VPRIVARYCFPTFHFGYELSERRSQLHARLHQRRLHSADHSGQRGLFGQAARVSVPEWISTVRESLKEMIFRILKK